MGLVDRCGVALTAPSFPDADINQTVRMFLYSERCESGVEFGPREGMNNADWSEVVWFVVPEAGGEVRRSTCDVLVHTARTPTLQKITDRMTSA